MRNSKQWIIRNKKADFDAISKELGISPVLARVIRNRDIIGTEEMKAFLRPSVTGLHSPSLLPNINEAAYNVLTAIRDRRKIRIVGDYDVDGICSTYILWKTFVTLGADVDTVLPHRIRDGYGISEAIVRKAHEDGIGLIVTCDNGIAAAEPLRVARELGMKAVVTDHHEVPFTTVEKNGKSYVCELLPDAEAVVDPKMRVDKPYPFPDICGAAVALKLCMYIRSQTGRFLNLSPEEEKEHWKEMETFCALATICDVMPLLDENRVMVKRGLGFAGNTGNKGLAALIDVCGLTGRTLTCYHVGFVLGPCMNASGRLDTAELALDMFKETDAEKAMETARRLFELNEERKSMTQSGVEEAMALIDQNDLAKDPVLVVHLPDCHESLAGIIAGKIREYWYRPTFVFTGHVTLKGSGRSIEGFHMYNALNRHADLLVRFGGHAMAAGLTIEEKDLEAFRKAINETCGLTEHDLVEKVYVDMEISPSRFTTGMVDEFQYLEPCGTKNPKPLFVTGKAVFKEVKVFGKNHNVMKVTAEDKEGNTVCFTRFGESDDLKDMLDAAGKPEAYEDLLAGKAEIPMDVIYYPEINEWNGRRNVQHIVRDWRVK